ncbi:Ig-like domain-containing protein [Xylanibacter caecicola]|uniref:Ig-like domain-containing protein n=1 Tax=Xylanibacter caecicola TaxID=2736294 RepID=UPI002586FFF7|nr:Ig-like domain-containing protein [Xylanibacter caecicola]
MNKILRYSLIVMFAFICNLSFADTVITFDPATDKGTQAGSSTGADEVAKEGVTISVSPTGSLGNGQQYRVYKSSTMTIKSTVGNITKVELTCTVAGTAKYGPGCFGAVEGYTYNEKVGTWVGNANSISLVASSNQVRMTGIKVTVAQSGTETKKSAELAFNPTTIDVEKGSEFTAPAFTKATTATVNFSSDNEGVATVNANGVISLGLEEGTAVITATSDENAEFYAGKATCTINVFTYNTYKKATVVESGKEYLLVAQRDNQTMYAIPLAADRNYGYMNVAEPIKELTDEVKVPSKYQDGFIFTTEGTGYSIKDVATNRYITQQGTYNSFQISETPAAWTVEAQADGTFKIEMNGYILQWGTGTYTTFALYTTVDGNAVLPCLYVLDNTTTGINNPTVNVLDKNAPVYNLAGQRVSMDTKGILIQNGRKFINK